MANALFEADLIDKVGFNNHTVLLYAGILLFCQMMHQMDLELLERPVSKTSRFFVTYQVKHKSNEQ